MVLELLINTDKLRRSPGLMFFDAVILTAIAILFAMFLFPKTNTSIAVLAFITIGAVPLFNKLYSRDSYLLNFDKPFFSRHKTTIFLLLWFFLGIFTTYVGAYLILPQETSANVFSVQFGELDGIAELQNSISTGNLAGTSQHTSRFKEVFFLVLVNNLLVVLSATLLSFFYGAGGLFLIAWNSSILAAVIAKDISLSFAGFSGGIGSLLTGIGNTILSFFSYLPHGLPEILAYFIVSVTGAIFARDLFRGLFSTDFKWDALLDFMHMFMLALLLLAIGALIEASYFL